MSLDYVFAQGDGVLIAVFLTLVLMSVATWYLILAGIVLVSGQRKANRRFVEDFWNAREVTEAEQVARQSASPLGRIALAGINGLRHYRDREHARLGDACSTDEFLVRTIRNAMNSENARLQSGLALLASIGSTAPFVGLFGTVWGIYHALLDIAAQGSASMEVVAGPLGEALIATAAGLAAAIPAVLTYNARVRANRVLMDEMDAFAHDLHAFLTTGAGISRQPTSNAPPLRVAAEGA
ncbi:MAG: MotA/TolQ/ExbB proton channel family protein [Thiohalophilus sp.]|uniref:MotA/TolQ/ExbB proton channel family protein n=1 Tax=Thiohalophilus sp. TaxID=3028392 RepID=UPI002870046E|nr:MotA/TolQ/ExbB proton channel family protein [Thiohalophilus sp.]MDR9437017.1 MotA/TolQ/ExbB proton channel family protein [Thiohalophilus sp.]